MANTATMTNTEAAKGNVRNFRSSADTENFYRFVHENRLRMEAKMILEAVYKAMGGGKKAKKKKARSKRSSKKTLH